MHPPIRLDVSQKTFLGFSVRALVIAGLAGAAGLLAFFGLPALPLYLRAMLALLITGLGLAWAFGEIDGQTPEAWLVSLFAFRQRSRYFAHRAMREDGARPRVVFPAGRTAETREALPEQSAPSGPGFVWLSANAIGAAILAGLTLWLIQGGAARLLVMWRGL